MNKEKYLEILKNTIKYSMPQHEIKDILDELKEDNIIGYISDSEKHKEKAKRVEILIDKQDKSLNDILIEVLDKSNKLIKYVEKIFIEKSYRYSIYYRCNDFKFTPKLYNAINLNEYEQKLISEEIDNFTNIVFKDTDDKIVLRFVYPIKQFVRKIDKSEDFIMPNLWIYHKNLNILEYRFELIGADGDDEFYSTRLDGQISALQCKEKFSFSEFRSSEIIKYIVENKKSEVQEISQSLGLKKNSMAKLKVGTNKIMPFIGDFEEILEKNNELFNKTDETKEIKDILEKYITNIKKNAKYKSRLLSWYKKEEESKENKTKSKSKSILDIQVIFSYRDKNYDLFNFHEPKKLSGELMDFAIKYIIKVEKDTKNP
ncbi:hypothetical protein IZT14_001667 [Clostridium perfringens]|nr:hypothetical protein [Clostridium perfringens]HBI6919551.1 hypothetical protein [Clostridium perfringens]HBI7037979.1 hypothetical protein [Clostridium perfringens]